MALDLIKCGDHKMAPYCIICVHVGQRLVNACVALEYDDGRQTDYLCKACVEKLPDPPIDDLTACCIHCARDVIAGMEVIRPDARKDQP